MFDIRAQVVGPTKSAALATPLKTCKHMTLRTQYCASKNRSYETCNLNCIKKLDFDECQVRPWELKHPGPSVETALKGHLQSVAGANLHP